MIGMVSRVGSLAALTALPVGHEFEVPDVLFRKITDEERADWQDRLEHRLLLI